MEVTLIRHFMTSGNLRGAYIGSTDESLLANQVLQKDYKAVDRVIVSPLKRCVETAEIIYPRQKQIICKDLRECHFGVFEGKNYEELKGCPLYQKWIDSAGAIPFPEGERTEDFKLRCIEGFKWSISWLLEQKCEAAAIVVHGGTIMAIMEEFSKQKKEFYHWQVKNGEGYQFKIDEKKWRQGLWEIKQIQKL